MTVRTDTFGATAAMTLDGIYVWADHGKLVLTQRASLEYPYRQRERRTAIAHVLPGEPS